MLYTIGQVNLLFDRTQKRHLPAKELCSLFRVSTSSATAKAREIERAMKIRPFDLDWTLPSKLDDNPRLRLFETRDGIVLDARYLPRDLQEELAAAGLIPFVPSTSFETD